MSLTSTDIPIHESNDQIYASPGGVPLRCDILRPASDVDLPLVICLHGGGWVSGDKRDVQELAVTIARAGYVVICPNYRLAPLYPFPAALDDLRELVTWSAANAAAHGIDPSRRGVVGASAAAYLACMLGVLPYGEDNATAVDAVVSVAALTDLTRPREQHFPVCWSMIEQYMGTPYEGAEELYRQASPLYLVSESAAPCLLVHGEEDDIVEPRQSKDFAAALASMGVRAEIHLLPNEGHTLSVSAWENIQLFLLDFMSRHLCLL